MGELATMVHFGSEYLNNNNRRRLCQQVTITEVRNAQSLNAENTAFEVEINHPEFDWIPYHLSPDDTDMTVDNSVLLGLIGSDFEAYVAPTQEELDAELAAGLKSVNVTRS